MTIISNRTLQEKLKSLTTFIKFSMSNRQSWLLFLPKFTAVTKRSCSNLIRIETMKVYQINEENLTWDMPTLRILGVELSTPRKGVDGLVGLAEELDRFVLANWRALCVAARYTETRDRKGRVVGEYLPSDCYTPCRRIAISRNGRQTTRLSVWGATVLSGGVKIANGAHRWHDDTPLTEEQLVATARDIEDLLLCLPAYAR